MVIKAALKNVFYIGVALKNIINYGPTLLLYGPFSLLRISQTKVSEDEEEYILRMRIQKI